MRSIIASTLSFLTVIAAQVTFQNSSQTILRVDSGSYGPEIEEVHYYYEQWPIGIAVSSTGRIFASYTRGNYTFTLGETVNKTAERPYPSAGLNLPVNQLNTTWNGIMFGSGNTTGLISVQALYITPASSSRPETLWVVDTGRPTRLWERQFQLWSQPQIEKLALLNGGSTTADLASDRRFGEWVRSLHKSLRVRLRIFKSSTTQMLTAPQIGCQTP